MLRSYGGVRLVIVDMGGRWIVISCFVRGFGEV